LELLQGHDWNKRRLVIFALCEMPGVKGVKWATPDPLKLAVAKAACDGGVARKYRTKR